MGGLISLYAICEYPGVFGGAACLSTHWTVFFRSENNPIPGAIMSYLENHLPPPQNHKVYFDHGTVDIDALYDHYQKEADNLMRSNGFRSKNWETLIFKGEDHSENAWRKRLSIPLQFLMAP